MMKNDLDKNNIIDTTIDDGAADIAATLAGAQSADDADARGQAGKTGAHKTGAANAREAGAQIRRQKPELLAPSGDWDSFLAAINNGADAIYLGLGDFNARAKSTYFNTQNIRETVRYAHLRGVKIYVTINTLVSDEEMPNFIRLVEACIEARVDAYIVQDFGCATVLKAMFPDIELHASTQMGIHNVFGARVARDLGFSRVVLSREAKLADIIEIARLGIEIEFFVQGALCVAFSGNCYFSALAHGMSGNRGKCLQLCRLPYSASIDGQEVGSGYLLSARDLCMIDELNRLIDSGVISFKIEGRLRRAGYVAQAVHTYRQALDAISDHRDIDHKAEIRNLRQVFSRGDFNYHAYLDAGVPDDVINPLNQNHLGLKIGDVVSVERFKDLFKIGIRTPHPLRAGDGLKFCDKTGAEVDSLGVGNVQKQGNTHFIFTKHRLSTALDVYLTLNSSLEDAVLRNTRRVRINVAFEAQENHPIRVTARTVSGEKVTVTVTSDYICQPAKTAPTQEAEIRDIFGNLNAEIWAVDFDKIAIGAVFIPKSALKEARRVLDAQLSDEILAQYEQRQAGIRKVCTLDSITTPPMPQPQYDSITVINEKSDCDALNVGENDLIILAPMDYSEQNVRTFWDKVSRLTQHIGLALPTIANGQDCAKLKNIIDILPATTPLLVENAYGLSLGSAHPLIAGTGMNIYNSYTVAALQKLGVGHFVWSKEVPSPHSEAYQFAFGRQTLMHFAHCPFKTLWQNTCTNCHFAENLTFRGQDSREYRILRHKITQCYFTLLAENATKKEKIDRKYIDLR